MQSPRFSQERTYCGKYLGHVGLRQPMVIHWSFSSFYVQRKERRRRFFKVTTGTVWRTSSNSWKMLISILQIFLTSGFHFKNWKVSLNSVNWKQMCCSKGSAGSGHGSQALISYNSPSLLADEHRRILSANPTRRAQLPANLSNWPVFENDT